jgi:mannose-1-phosphate guanylyltransferase
VKNIQVVIMAGGVGTRFWPLSRASRPKQFLPIASERSMLEETAKRLLPLVPWAQIRTVANAAHTRLIHSLLPRIPKRNLLVEPAGRNTAPSLILATAHVYLQDPEVPVVVLPSDHFISNPTMFLKQLKAGAQAAVKEKKLITFGMLPAFPATGYGYIHVSTEAAARHGGFDFYKVLEFKEKPQLAEAHAFLASGDYFWNSGMFIWTPRVFAATLEAHAPEFHAHWLNVVKALKRKNRAGLNRVFKAMPATSIDYALMEKASGVLVSPGRFTWSDVGAWSSLLDVWQRDKKGNVSRGEVLSLDSEGSLVYNPGNLTALIGVRDLVIVNAGDALLICHRDRDQSVKDVLGILGKNRKRKYL